ncbi:restriction endonuclease subunit S [Helicobacter pylori]|uniref:restriction endonuclease subunit S n=1 Tax=Helicobacter pylori TaxID=210 RepID=UPI0013CE0584|nr:restriction endonuclease subunit S [Helicobacter pylori]
MDALMLPLNWQRVRLGDMGITISGLVGKTKQDFINGNAKYITFLNVLNNVIIDTSILENVKIYPNEKQNSFKKYDLFFNTSSETPKEVGMCAVLLDDIDQVFLNSFCFGFRIFDKAVDGLFLSYLINSEIGRKAFENLAQGSTRYNLSKSSFNNVCLFLPPLNEQIAIANILSDLDHYLYTLDALILKKESVKKALSFELLSQRKRLKGFNQAWQRVRLGDIAEIKRGASPRPIENPKWFCTNSNVGWVRISDISKNSRFLYKTAQKLSKKGIEKSRFIKQNSLIMSMCATIGKPIITKIDTCIHDGFVVFENPKIDLNYLYYFLCYIEKEWLESGQQGSQVNLNVDLIKNKEVFCPKDLNEQIAIANILSGLDHEIASLKNKKRQFDNIKKALNHDLMSAKIRVLKK